MSAFAAKLELVLKNLSISRGQLAALLAVDKAVAGRWVSGATTPSPHNLSRLTATIAKRVPGFSLLDWDLELEALRRRLDVDIPASPEPPQLGLLPLSFIRQALTTTTVRGAAYEGFFRSTRVHARRKDVLVHDHGMIRRDEAGLLRLTMGTGGVFTDGWMLPLYNQVFCVGTERTTGTPVFGVFHGVAGVKASVLDGLTLTSIMDAGRTPTAAPIVLHRVGDLSGEADHDDATFMRLAEQPYEAPLESIPPSLLAHLYRDSGPTALALGGDMVMRSPLARSIAG